MCAIWCLYNSEVKVGRHLVCEPCGPNLAGGFDQDRNQVNYYATWLTFQH